MQRQVLPRATVSEASALSTRTGRPEGPIGALEQSSGARWRSEKVQEGRRREHRWRHRRVAGEVLVTGPMRASRGAEGGDGGGLGPAMWTFVHKRVLWTYVHKAYLWAIAARSEEA